MTLLPRPVPPPPAFPKPALRAGEGRPLQPKQAPRPVLFAPPPTRFGPAPLQSKPVHRAGACCDECAAPAPAALASPKPTPRLGDGRPTPAPGAVAPRRLLPMPAPPLRSAAAAPAAPAMTAQLSRARKAFAEKREQAQKNWKQYKCYEKDAAAQIMKRYDYDDEAIFRKLVGCGLGTTGAYPGHCSGNKGSGKNNATPGKCEAIRTCLDGSQELQVGESKTETKSKGGGGGKGGRRRKGKGR